MLNPGMVVLCGFGCFGVVDPDIQYSAGEFGKPYVNFNFSALL